MLVVVFVGGLAGVVVVFGWVLGVGHVRNWGSAEAGTGVYMYYL